MPTYDVLASFFAGGSKVGEPVHAFFDARVLCRPPVAHRSHQQLEIFDRPDQGTLKLWLPGGSALHDTGCDALDTCCQSGQAAGLADPGCRDFEQA